MGSILALVGGIVNFIFGIVLLVAAFKRSVGTGFLTLCVPFYIFYFMFAQYQSPKKKMVITVWFVSLVLYIIGAVINTKAQMGALAP